MGEWDAWTVSQQLERVALTWRAWKRALLIGQGCDDDPFAQQRSVITRQSFQAATGLEESHPLREPLRRWIYRLLEQRVNRQWILRVRQLGSQVTHPLPPPLGGDWTLSGMLRNAIVDPVRREGWLDAWRDRSAELSMGATWLWQRRAETARRLELVHPDELEAPAPGLTELAHGWLASSQDLWTSLQVRDLSQYLSVATGSGAEEGWPSRLTLRTVAELLGASEWLRGVDWEPGRLPPALGPASFLRALARAGAAWADALAPPDQPFVVAHDAYGPRRRVFGALFGTLPLDLEFVRRRLSVPTFRRAAHVRWLADVVLAESRRAALAVLLRAAALRNAGAWAEELPSHSAQALGVTLRPEWAGALVRLHVDTPHRFVGLLLAADRVRRLREAYDVDWFRNPRAIEELRAEAGAPVPLLADPAALVRGRDALLGWLVAAHG